MILHRPPLLLMLLLLSSFLVSAFLGADLENYILADPISATALFALGAGSALVNGISNAVSNRRNYEYSNELNEYNSPVNQRRRLEQAGINPALALHAGQLGSGNATQAPVHNPYQVDPSVMQQPVIDSQLANSNIELNSENARYARARADSHAAEVNANILEQIQRVENMRVDQKEKRQMIRLLTQQYNYNQSTEEDNKRILKLSHDNMYEDLLTKRFERDLQASQFALQQKLTAANIQQLSALTAKLATETSEMVKNGASQRDVNDWINKQASFAVQGLSLDNDQKRKLLPWIVAAAKKDYSSVYVGGLGKFAAPSYVFK